MTGQARPAGGRSLAVILAALTLLGPVAMDLYLPVLPALARDLGASTSTAQLTMTACLAGLALGQVVAGPASDRLGRRAPLIAGLVIFTAASLFCALSDSAAVLLALRLVQGMAAAAGLVIALAIGRDVYEGRALTRYYSRIVVISGLAAVAAPVLGGQLAAVLDWRGFFLLLAVVGAVITLVVAVAFRETLQPAARTRRGGGATGAHLRTLCDDRLFLGAMVVSSFTAAAYFAYLAGASFVLQDIYQLAPSSYSLVFGLCAAGFAVAGLVTGRAVERWPERRLLEVGIGIGALGSAGLLMAAVLGLSLLPAVASFFLIAVGAAVVSPPSTSLALADYPQFAGTASAALGVARFAAGGVAAPLVGLGGATTMIPLGLVCVVAAVGAVASYALLVRDHARAALSTA